MTKQQRRPYLSWTATVIKYALIVIVVSFVANLWLTRNQAAGPAPAINGQMVDGSQISVNYQQYQQPLVVYFFADWCPICRFQHSVIDAIDKDYSVIGVAMQSSANPELSAYLQQQHIQFPVINDRDGSVSRAFGVQGVPATFVINNNAEIAFSTRGYVSQAGLLARIWWSRLGW